MDRQASREDRHSGRSLLLLLLLLLVVCRLLLLPLLLLLLQGARAAVATEAAAAEAAAAGGACGILLLHLLVARRQRRVRVLRQQLPRACVVKRRDEPGMAACVQRGVLRVRHTGQSCCSQVGLAWGRKTGTCPQTINIDTMYSHLQLAFCSKSSSAFCIL
jgi:hypothetical protein